MAGLIALMGGDEFRRDCEPMDRALLARLGPAPRVVVLPTAAARENPSLAARNGVRYFLRLGARATPVMITNLDTARQTALVTQIEEADLVYFTGGDPVHLLNTMRQSPAWEAATHVYATGGMLAGSSAGAMICGGQMWAPPIGQRGEPVEPSGQAPSTLPAVAEQAPGEGWRDGLGLVPNIAVLPHHATLSARWNAQSMGASLPSGITLVGIDVATALVWPEARVIGPGQVVVYGLDGTRVYTDGQDVHLPTAPLHR